MTESNEWEAAFSKHCRAAGHFDEADLAQVSDHLGEALGPFNLITLLWRTLEVPLRTLREVENWVPFHG
jgi:hypothetical protein